MLPFFLSLCLCSSRSLHSIPLSPPVLSPHLTLTISCMDQLFYSLLLYACSLFLSLCHLPFPFNVHVFSLCLSRSPPSLIIYMNHAFLCVRAIYQTSESLFLSCTKILESNQSVDYVCYYSHGCFDCLYKCDTCKCALRLPILNS